MKTEVRNTYEVVRGITLSTKFVLANGETVRVRMQGHNGSKKKIKGTHVTSDPALIKAMDAANGNAANGGREFRLKLSEKIEPKEVVKEESKREVDPVDPKVEQPVVPNAAAPVPQDAVAPVQTGGDPKDLRLPRDEPTPVPEPVVPVVPSKAAEGVKEGSPADEVPEAQSATQEATTEEGTVPSDEPQANAPVETAAKPQATKVPDVKNFQAAKSYLAKNHGQSLADMPNKVAVLKAAAALGVEFPNMP